MSEILTQAKRELEALQARRRDRAAQPWDPAEADRLVNQMLRRVNLACPDGYVLTAEGGAVLHRFGRLIDEARKRQDVQALRAAVRQYELAALVLFGKAPPLGPGESIELLPGRFEISEAFD